MLDARDKAKSILVSALRQYRHNNSDDYVAGFDYEDTLDLVAKLLDSAEYLISEDKHTRDILKLLTNSL